MSQIGSSFAKILVGLDGSNYSQAAMEYACQIALKHSAVIIGVAVIDLPGIQHSSGPVPAGAVRYAERAEQRLREQTQEKVDEILQSFQQVCDSKGVSYTLHADTGTPFEEIIEESKYHDFIVIGQKTFFRHNISDEPGDTLDRILRRGITPVFAVPESVGEVKKVLVASDNSIQSARAIRIFFLLGIWTQCPITLINVNDDEDAGNEVLNKLGEYLESYGVQPEKVCLKGKPDSVITSYIQENEIDLLVMGAYGKNNLRSFFFGSVTKELIEKTNIPLFIYH